MAIKPWLALAALTMSFQALAQNPSVDSHFNVVVGQNPPPPPPSPLNSGESTANYQGEPSSLNTPLSPQSNGWGNSHQSWGGQSTQGAPQQANGQMPPKSHNQTTQSNNSHTPSAGVDNAFYQSTQMINPLNSEQAMFLYQKYLELQKTKSLGFHPPERKVRTLVFNQAPGKKPPSVYMYRGHSTSLVFTDGTGNPWPIAKYNVGNPAAYSVMHSDEQDSAHILNISPIAAFIPTNLTILLKDRSMPMVIDLESNQHRTDSLVTVSVGGLSPTNTTSFVTAHEIPSLSENNRLLAPFLDNTPPDGAYFVPVIGDQDTLVWFWKNRFIVRTKNILTNPTSADASKVMNSPHGGWRVYDIGNDVPPVFSMLDTNGDFMHVTVGVDEVYRQ